MLWELIVPCIAIAGGFGIASMRRYLLMVEPEEIQRGARDGIPWAARALRLARDPARTSKGLKMALDLLFIWGSLSTLKQGMELGPAGIFLVVPYVALFLLVGEYLPETHGLKWLKVLPTFIVDWARISLGISWPWVKLGALLNWVLGVKGGVSAMEESPVSVREEIVWKIRSSEETAPHLQEERKMIERILKFSDTKVKEVMIPLIDVCAVEEGTSIEGAIELIRREGYSRMPVYRERIDNVVGMVRALDLLSASDLKQPVKDYLRPVTFVPENMPVDELLLLMKRGGQHLAMVVDEYGGTVGLITLEDLMEEIVGQIEDEYDTEEPKIRWVSSFQAIVDARTEIEELNDRLGLNLPKGDYETLAGLLLDAFKRLPSPGDSIVLDHVRLTVRNTSERRIEEVLITMPRQPRKESKTT